MKKILIFIFSIIFISCSDKKDSCEEHSWAYWTTTMTGKPHNTRIENENIRIRKEFEKLVKSENEITPSRGFITLKIHIDKKGEICNIENYKIDEDYISTEFNDGELIKKINRIAINLDDWKNDTNTKTYYLIRLKVNNGSIEEVF